MNRRKPTIPFYILFPTLACSLMTICLFAFAELGNNFYRPTPYWVWLKCVEEDGRRARKNGINPEANPYIGITLSSKAWLDGYMKEKKEEVGNAHSD